MEGYRDNIPLPKPKPKPMLEEQKKGNAKAPDRGKAKEIAMERNRRGKITDFYKHLHSMVPNLFPKATRTKIIDETITYIKGLEEHIVELEARRKKAELDRVVTLQKHHTSSSIDITVSGHTIFFGIRSMARRGLMSRVLGAFERHNADVLATSVARNEGQVMLTVTAVINGRDHVGPPPELVIQRIRNDLLVCLS